MTTSRPTSRSSPTLAMEAAPLMVITTWSTSASSTALAWSTSTATTAWWVLASGSVMTVLTASTSTVRHLVEAIICCHRFGGWCTRTSGDDGHLGCRVVGPGCRLLLLSWLVWIHCLLTRARHNLK